MIIIIIVSTLKLTTNMLNFSQIGVKIVKLVIMSVDYYVIAQLLLLLAAKTSPITVASYRMTTNNACLSTYLHFKTSLFIKHMSLISKINSKNVSLKNYERMPEFMVCLTNTAPDF